MTARSTPRSASVKDVAALAGVSLGTVSNVLNSPDRVSVTTRARVRQAIVDLGFVRNESARQLRAGQSRVIAYVMLDGGNPFFTDVARGVEDIAEGADLSLFMCDSHQDIEREHAYLRRLEQQRVQGVLVTPVDPSDPALDDLRRRGTPVVLVDRTRSDSAQCSVSVNDTLGGRLAAEHLLDLGHRRIAFVGGPERIGQVRDRRNGVLAALESAGLPPESLVVVATDASTVDDGRGAGTRLAGLDGRVRPTAAVCANDMVALGLLQRRVELGVAVPDDLAIIGYDDIEFAAAAAVPLTSVRQPRHELGRTAADLLLEETQDPQNHIHRQIEFEPD